MKVSASINQSTIVVRQGTEVRVVYRMNDQINPKTGNPYPPNIVFVEEVGCHIEVPDNGLLAVAGANVVGVVRIQGYMQYLDGSVSPYSMPNGHRIMALMQLKYQYAKKSILILSKAKSITDLIYLVQNPHLNSVPLISDLLEDEKLFKEFQRLLGQKLVDIHVDSVKAITVDLDKYYQDHNVAMEEAGDGMAFCKWDVNLTLPSGTSEPLYSTGMRIINHPVLRISKANLIYDNKSFNRIAKWAGIDPSTVDIILPKIAVKVSRNLELGVVYDVTKHIRYISYKTKRTQSYARLSTVGAVNHGMAANVFSSLIDKFTNVESINDLICRTMAGELDAFTKLIKAGTGNDLMGSALNVAFPIWKDGKWQLIKTAEIVNNLYKETTSAFTKHVRKVRIKGGFNRRAANSIKVEQLNKNNNSGVYIVDIRNGVAYIPQNLFTTIGLGDFDGDDIVFYPVRVSKKDNLAIFIGMRNPSSGNTAFIAIQKGKGTIKDVPEWAMNLVNLMSGVVIPNAPKADKAEPVVGFANKVGVYIDQMFNAAIAAPLLGMCTNSLYKTRILQQVTNNYACQQIVMEDAHALENGAVKAIKSTLTKGASLEDIITKFSIKFGGEWNSMFISKMMLVGDFLDEYTNIRADMVIPKPDLDSNITAKQVWDLCSKYNYKTSYKAYMELIVKSAKLVAEQYASTIPICMAAKGLVNADTFIDANGSDVIVANQVCTAIVKSATQLGLEPASQQYVDMVNTLYTIFTSRKNPMADKYYQVTDMLLASLMEVRKNGYQKEELVQHKNKTANKLLRMLMDVPENTGINEINRLYCAGARVVMGIRDINDDDIRAYAYACVHSYIKSFIKYKFSSDKARATAMFITGKRVFGMANGRVRSNRLFWLYAATFSKESIMEISNLWMTVQERQNHVGAVRPVSSDTMSDMFDVVAAKGLPTDEHYVTPDFSLYDDINGLYDDEAPLFDEDMSDLYDL